MQPETQSLLRYLDQAVADTFETTCFAEVTPESGPVPDSLEALHAAVSFAGDAAGRMELSLGIPAASNLAASFLGLSMDELLPEQVESVCGELINMICGATLSLAKTDGRFELQSPDVRRTPPARECWSLTRAYNVDAAPVHIRANYRSRAESKRTA